MNKLSIFATSLAATALLVGLPLSSQEIVVSPRSGSTYVAEVSKDLQQQMDAQDFDTGWAAAGIAKVRFQAGADGRAVNIRTYRRSGDRMLDVRARQVVGRLSSLYPLPDGASAGTVIQANIIVARSRRHLDQLTRKLAREEAQRMAASPEERTVLALTLVPGPAS